MKRFFLVVSCFFIASMTFLCQAQEATSSENEQRVKKRKIFDGLTLSADLVGPIMYKMSDQGDFQASLQANINGLYHPIVEIGYGKADKQYEDEKVIYNTKAPFLRIGCDLNVLKNKHDDYLLLVGVRYGMTSFDFDTTDLNAVDTELTSAVNEKCTLQWMELVLGVDAKVWGPIHMGWSFRYRKRLSVSDYQNKPLYAPGYGNADAGSRFMALYTIGLHI